MTDRKSSRPEWCRPEPLRRRPDELTELEAIPWEQRALPDSTYALLRRAARRWPDRTALTVLPSSDHWDDPVRRTHAELLGDVHRVANLLHELGVRRDDAVALLSPNCDELITVLLAAQTAGIAAPMHAGLSDRCLATHLDRCAARILVTAGPELDPALWETARALAVTARLDAVLVVRPTGAVDPPPALPAIRGVRVGYLSELAADQPADRFAGVPPGPTDLAGFFLTSGTTGTPKIVAHTQANEVSNAWMIAARSVLDESTVLFTALPLFHVASVVVALLAPLLQGHTVVWGGPHGYHDPGWTDICWKIIEAYRVTAISAVPTFYAVLAQIPVNADIASLRLGFVGSAPLPDAVRDQFEDRTGATLVEAYGLTEATCTCARGVPEAPRPGAIGQRLPYLRAKAIRVDDVGRWHDLPTGEAGLLALRGPIVFAGYVTDHDGTAHVLDRMGTVRDGWLNTGDLGRVDTDGFIHLTGRAKDVIISHGHNVDPAVIEDVLLRHPAVHAAAAVGRPDASRGEAPVAYVTLHPGAAAEEEELRAWAAERIDQRIAIPCSILILDSLPLTPFAKPYRMAMRADATRRAVTEALAALPGRVVVDATEVGGSIIVTVIARHLSPEEIEQALARYAITWRLETAE